MKKINVPCRVKCFYHKIHAAAHRAEYPLHISYLATVFYTSHAAYAYIAILAALAMLLAWDFKA